MNKHISLVARGAALAAVFVIAGCSTQSVRTSSVNTATEVIEPVPEHLLLDAGIDIFDPGMQYLDEEESTTAPSVRKAEGAHSAYTLAKTMRRTGNWGAVNVIPKAQSETDVYVRGTVVESDGESLTLDVTVSDASGNTWYTRKYSDTLSQYAYDKSLHGDREPFQRLYDKIANDMEHYMVRLEPAKRENLQTISKLRFAQRFAPQQYNDFMDVDSNGKYTLKRLPAEGDPIIQHVESIRVRDKMFVERLQDYYATFDDRMLVPYDQWREASYHETKALRKLESEATTRKIGGALAVIAGILAQGSRSRAARAAGVSGIGLGAYLFKSGLDKGSEAKIHHAALKEMSDSLGAEVEPHTVALADKAVTLSGTVDEQYAQWRAILNEIYLAEIGQLSPQEYSDTDRL